MRKVYGAAVAGVVGLAAFAGEAYAQSCADEIKLLAQQYALSDSPTQAEPRRDGPRSGSMGVSPEDLGRSGGVIAPPESARGRVVEPPPVGDPMATTPDVPQQTPQHPDARRAAQRAQMQSLLDAARAAERQGNEAECLDRVARARSLAEPG